MSGFSALNDRRKARTSLLLVRVETLAGLGAHLALLHLILKQLHSVQQGLILK
jgi:hypothetical protein